MYIYKDFGWFECVLETMPFAKRYVSVDNGTLHINFSRLHFLANRTRRGWRAMGTTNVIEQPVHPAGD